MLKKRRSEENIKFWSRAWAFGARDLRKIEENMNGKDNRRLQDKNIKKIVDKMGIEQEYKK
jgi:hypothetical protein